MKPNRSLHATPLALFLGALLVLSVSSASAQDWQSILENQRFNFVVNDLVANANFIYEGSGMSVYQDPSTLTEYRNVVCQAVMTNHTLGSFLGSIAFQNDGTIQLNPLSDPEMAFTIAGNLTHDYCTDTHSLAHEYEFLSTRISGKPFTITQNMLKMGDPLDPVTYLIAEDDDRNLELTLISGGKIGKNMMDLSLPPDPCGPHPTLQGWTLCVNISYRFPNIPKEVNAVMELSDAFRSAVRAEE